MGSLRLAVWAGVGAVAILAVSAPPLFEALSGREIGPESGILPYRDERSVDRGRVLYGEHCASCHGDNLEGQPDWRQPDDNGYLPAPPHDPSGHTWHHDDPLLVQLTRLGTAAVVGGDYQSRMPGFEDVLSEEQIREILAFIKSTWPQEIIDRHNELNAERSGTADPT
jgi:mono/diheme cytochrome c family protein